MKKPILALALILTLSANSFAGWINVYLNDDNKKHPPILYLWDGHNSSNGTRDIFCSTWGGVWEVYKWYYSTIVYPKQSTSTTPVGGYPSRP